MTLKKYLIAMSAATLICWLIFIFVAGSINPELTNYLGFSLFYSSLFLAITGLAALVGFFIRFVILKKDLVFYAVRVAFRQSFLFSFFIISILLLLSQELLSWFNLVMLIMIFLIMEIFIIRSSKNR